MLRKSFVPALLAVIITLGACTPMSPTATTTVESVDIAQYLGTWYELGSVKQFFSVGLVNTKAEYSLLPSGNVKVVNSGRYFSNTGPVSRIVGTAVPVDSSNARLNVSFSGSNTATPPGNYWIVDLASDYSWAIVSDATGRSGFILSRDASVDPAFYAELVQKAADKGVDTTNLTVTPQLGGTP
ncbi:MAG: lipocalin family protein [Microthrixaceae bacterium]